MQKKWGGHKSGGDKPGRACTYSVGAISRLYSAAVEEEADGCWSFALSLAEGIHQLLECGGPLDLEKDLVVVIRDLDIQVLTLSSAFGLLSGTRTSILVGSRHFGRR